MAKAKISELPALSASPANDDILPIVDISDGSGVTKKVTMAELQARELGAAEVVTWYQKWKIALDGTDLVFYYWTGSAWAEHSRLEPPE